VDAYGLVITTRVVIDRKMIDKSKTLCWIGRLGSGMELVDEVYAAEKGIACISTPEGNRNAVGEHTLGLILSLLKNISKSHHEIKNGQWLRAENTGEELSGKTIGIIGYGNTGSAFGKLLSSFDVKVMAYDKYKSGFGNDRIKEVTIKDIFSHADIVSMHVPLTTETRHMADEHLFNSFTKPVYYISTCRGGVTSTEALMKAIKEKKVIGAALDVLENENLATYNSRESAVLDYLLNHERIIITPHIAGYSHQAFDKMPRILLEKLDQLERS
ncbi:MAG TPA: NAD(P)-dependent oxidoreductase, partial [Chitinophagaceae bacterium]